VLLTRFPGFLITELSCGGLLQELSLRLEPRPSWAPWGGGVVGVQALGLALDVEERFSV